MAIEIFKMNDAGDAMRIPLVAARRVAPQFWPALCRSIRDLEMERGLYVHAFHVTANSVTVDVLVPMSVDNVEQFRCDAQSAVEHAVELASRGADVRAVNSFVA